MEDKKDDLKEILAQCEKERDEYLDGWKRAKADFSNYKKEELSRFENFAKLSNEILMRGLINILDSFNLGITVLEASPAKKGMMMIKRQLEDLLEQHGLEKIEAAIGQTFDPASQEAVAEVASDLAAGFVVEEVETGYRLHGKVLRPARVNLSKGQT